MTLRRLLALLIALCILAALIGQFILNGNKPSLVPWGARLWDLARFFTILTNSLVGVALAQVAFGRRDNADLMMTGVINIVMVCVIYQTLLAPAQPFTGLNWWTDFAFHLGVPGATLLWWLAYGDHGLALRRLPLWLIWPVLYCIYALIRGGFTASYPYFFLDVARFGWGQIGLNIMGLVLVFALAGAAIWGAGQMAQRLRSGRARA